MNKEVIVLYKEDARTNNKSFNKLEIIKKIIEKFDNAERKNIKFRTKEDCYDVYTVVSDFDVTEIVFPHMFKKENEKLENFFEGWYTINSKRKRRNLKRDLRRLELCAIIGAGILAGAKLAEVAAPVFDDIGDAIEEKMDYVGFYFGNMGEISDIKELEREIKAHTGYGEIDGYKQSIEDHNDSYCALGDDLNSNEVVAAIYEYCNENGLGNTVANAAGDKFVLLQQDNTTAAYEIDLLDIYRDEKIKTLK